jgi:hypothetical protein
MHCIDYGVFVVFDGNRYDWPQPMPMGRYGRCSASTVAGLWTRGGREASGYRLVAAELYITEMPFGPGDHTPRAIHLSTKQQIRDCAHGSADFDELHKTHAYPYGTLMATLEANETERCEKRAARVTRGILSFV